MNINKAKGVNVCSCWLPLLLGVFITSLTALWLNYQNDYEVDLYTNTLADKADKLIKQRFEHFEYGLRGIRGAISAVGVDQVNRPQFEKYSLTRDIRQEFPGALGFGFIRKVPLNQEATFIANAIKDNAPNFTIKTLTPHNNDRFVIQYIYPQKENEQAIGLDIGSESNRRGAALAAAKYDKPYLTEPITLVQKNKKTRKGALVLLPVYRDGASLTTEQLRLESVVGWSYAPLVIDDVLESLELQADQAYLVLNNIEENDPFYHSKNSIDTIALKYKTVRSIHVLGQNWLLSLAPSYDVVNQIKPWRVDWVIFLGLGLTFFTLLIINLLRGNSLPSDQGDKTYQLSFKSLSVFFASPQFKRLMPFSGGIFFLIFLISSWLIIQGHLTEVSRDLSKSKKYALSVLADQSDQYQKDVLFLANTPVIRDLKQIPVDTINLEESNKLKRLNERLANIFKAYMLSKVDVHQVRFIGASQDWRERVKVQRFGSELKTINKEELQSKKNEPYIADTIKMEKGSVFLSDINLNREFDKIEIPRHPVWRFSTPLHDPDGNLLGIIIINVSAQNILKSVVENVTGNSELYLTNTQGDYLLNPVSSKEFLFEYGHSPRWQDDFKFSDSILGLDSFDLMSYVGEHGRIFVKQAIFELDDQADKRALKIYSTSPEALVFKPIAIKIVGVIISLILVTFISIIIQYWVWLSDVIRHRDSLKSQMEIQRNKEMLRFKGLLESAPDATFVVNELGIIQMVNEQAEIMFGYPRAELEGQPIAKLVPEYLLAEYTGRVLEYINNSETTASIESGIELLALAANGEEFPVETSLSSVNLDEKTLISASVRNIKERYAAEEKLRKALRDAELATEAKSAFLANTSHEIRTPLNAIIGLGYLLSEEELTETQQQLVAKIQISGKSLLGIVNDVLDLAKIEANEMILEEQPLELRELIEDVSGIFSVQAEAKNLKFNTYIDPQLPAWVMADSIRLSQILTNLLGNALKFTTIGKISIYADVLTEASELLKNQVTVRFSIVDTGIGISAEAQERLFKPFTQADSSTTRRFGGTGLGLSIVHELVQMMGGQIGIESGENKGSKFWLDLPFKVQTHEEIAAQDYQKQTLFVLIAEDDPADAMQLQKMTRALGWRSEVVNNGDELVNTYLARQEKKLRPPDAMIVDWQMPIMDGLGAVSALAQRIGRKNLPAILMVSAHEKEAIIQQDADNLVNNFIMKPVNSSVLFNAVNDVVTLTTGNSKRVMQSTHTPAVAAKWLPGARILVVDDSPINLVVVSHMLEHNGAIIQTANSGEEAITVLADSKNKFDAVLMDVQMPGIDGLETTRRIRNQLEMKNLPIIALTAGALLEEKTRALEAGMNDFLTKPINPAKLINVVRMLVETHRGSPLAIESLDSKSKEDPWPEINGLNIPRAKTLLMGDKSLFFTTLNGLLKEHSNLMQPPAGDVDSIEMKDERLQLASQAHKLRSASGMVGAERIQQYAADAENILRDDNQSAANVLIALSSALQELQQASIDILNDWQKEKLEKMSTKRALQSNFPLLKIEDIQEILVLLNEQDLQALEKIEECSISLHQMMGSSVFKELQQHLESLNYKEAIQLLEALMNTLGEG